MSVQWLGRASRRAPLCLPLFSQPVAAGFPSPAQDHVEQRLDLNGLCIKHPQATYFVRAKGDSMVEHGIVSGDILVVDRALEARHGDIIIASLQGDFTVKRLCLHPTPCLQPGNPAYPPIAIEEDNPPDIFGVVTFVVHPTRLS